MKLEWIQADDKHEADLVAVAFRDDLPDHRVAEIWFCPEKEIDGRYSGNDNEPYLVKKIRVIKKISWGDSVKIKTLSVSDPWDVGTFKTEEEAKREAEDAVAVMYEEERPSYKYTSYDDFYGYKLLDDDKPNCWYIEGRDGRMLIGDGLPSTEAEAKEYCRCANIAHRHAVQKMKEKYEQRPSPY